MHSRNIAPGVGPLLFPLVFLLAVPALFSCHSRATGGAGSHEATETTRRSLAVYSPGFQEATVLRGLDRPTAVRFAADGRVFVAEKRGRILVFDNIDDPTPATFATLDTNVHDFWDRGLLGLALHPQFPTQPFVYALYALDAPVGGTPPVWNDECP